MKTYATGLSEAAAALLNSQRQLKLNMSVNYWKPEAIRNSETKVENELNKLKSTIVRLLTVENPNSVDTEKILNGVAGT